MFFTRSQPDSRALSHGCSEPSPDREGVANKWTLVLCLFLASCTPRDPQSAHKLSAAIRDDLRHDRLLQALDRSRRAEQTWRKYPESEPFIEFRLLESESLLATGKASEAMGILSGLAVNAKLQARYDVDLGRTLLQLGRKDEALNAVDRGIAESASANLDALHLEGLILKGWLLFLSHRDSEAQEIYRTAVSESDRLHDTYQSGKIFNNLGNHYFKQGRYDQVLPYYERAHDFFERAQAPRLGSAAAGNLAICYHQLGDFDRALQMQMQAISVQERLGANLDLVYSYGEAGRLYLAQGDRQKAIDSYQRAFELANQLKAPSRAALLAANLSEAYVMAKDWANAESFNREALKLNHSEDEQIDLQVKLNGGGIALGRQHIEEARKQFEDVAGSPDASHQLRWNSYDELGKLSAPHDSALSVKYFEKAIAVITADRTSLTKKEDRITFLSGVIGVYRDYVQSLVDRREYDKALLLADSSRAQILMESGAIVPPTIPALVHTAREAKAVILFYWVTPQSSAVWIISAAGVRRVELAATEAQIGELVTAYRYKLEHSAENALVNRQSAGWKLSDLVLKPLQPWIPDQARVILIPDGPLHEINFETLPVSGDKPAYWIEQVTLSIAPSLRGLSQPALPDKGRSGGLLIVGDAVPEGEFTKLAYASAEIQSVRQRYLAREKTLTGAQATVQAYWEAHPERFSLIHFTAHADANRLTPLDSAIILSRNGDEYKLYARDIASGLRAELVTVSGCRSAGSKAFQGEGPVGFAWAFLHAGARNVIAGLWNVNDKSTAQLMDRLYGGLEAGKTPPQALRQAKLQMLHSTDLFRKPYYWGPFQVYTQSAK